MKARRTATSLTVVQLTFHQLGHWVYLLTTQLADRTPLPTLQGSLASIVVVPDVVGYSVLLHAREEMEQDCWSHLEVHRETSDLDPRL